MREITRACFAMLFMLIYSFGWSQSYPPVAVNDTVVIIIPENATPYWDSTYYINILENDFDPNGQAVEIDTMALVGSNSQIQFSDSCLIFSAYSHWGQLYERVYKYKIREIDDTMAISKWAYLNLNPAFHPDYPVARNDTFYGIPNYQVHVNVLRNDYHPLGDSMWVAELGWWYGDSTVLIHFGHVSYNSYYYISDSANVIRDLGIIHKIVEHNDFYDSLDVNNINARFNAFGSHFYTHENLDYDQHFKVPNGQHVSSIYRNMLWIGGLDSEGNIHLAADHFNTEGHEFKAGPVSITYDSLYDARWYKVWKLNQTDIDFHRANWWVPGYEPIEDIATWPGNGNTDLGQSEQIAPFIDKNDDGVYDPLKGDAPRIKGDQALFFVFNDDRLKEHKSGGIPMGIEVRGMAYAFDQPDDSALWHTIFMHYDIVNRSDTAYDQVQVGLFTGSALGEAWDDRIGCDVSNGMYFNYNAGEIDGNPNSPYFYGYGEHPPAIGVQFLGGPYMEPDGIDNPKYDVNGNQIVDNSINGLNFGDAIIDNERLGMTSFLWIEDYPGGWITWPEYVNDFYNFIRGYWIDGSKLLYGKFGHNPGLGNHHAAGPECNFMWPGDSDPLNWGTNGLVPNDGYNQNGKYWTHDELLNGSTQQGIGSTGPFSFEPDDVVQLDVAFVWARDYNGTAWESALLLKDRAAYIKGLFQDNPDIFSEVEIIDDRPQFLIFPNPTAGELNVRMQSGYFSGTVRILNIFGNLIREYSFINLESIRLDMKDLVRGLYIVQLSDDSGINSYKVIKQ